MIKRWFVNSAMWIFHLFDNEMFRLYSMCGALIVMLLYLLYLVLSEGAVFVRDNEDGTQTEYFCFGKRIVKKEE